MTRSTSLLPFLLLALLAGGCQFITDFDRTRITDGGATDVPNRDVPVADTGADAPGDAGTDTTEDVPADAPADVPAGDVLPDVPLGDAVEDTMPDVPVDAGCMLAADCDDLDDCTDNVCTAGACTNPDSVGATVCDDGIACTGDGMCDGAGTCDPGTASAGMCLIAGACVMEAATDVSPMDCQACVTATSQTDWTILPDTAACLTGTLMCDGISAMCPAL